jgi:hypothetical protein
MKFGHNLPRNQVPEWASSYIDYKGLKKLIKSASSEVQAGEIADLAGMSMVGYSDMGIFTPTVALPSCTFIR